ncbi:MAG: AAA family ATPase [Candidatus Aminicenantes bacterium]|jgi:diguanylate cyclase (GGDEF)-like protein/PAS domain S-box-containing protein
MKTINNYRIVEELYEGNHSVVYRGGLDPDEQTAILKILKKEYPTPEEVARFKREYEITRNLGNEVPGVIKVFDIERYNNSLMMILEDFGGESLTRLTHQKRVKLDLTTFLHLALQITEILGEIHRHDVIHKDINPSNIVWNPESGQLKIIDFCISTVLPHETIEHVSPEALEGTLAYISPEQTGRMNCPLDYRTDFYSLGVTFYEMLTSQLPFDTKDPMELLHWHIARTPTTPERLNPVIPTVLTDIVVKLMAKNAEERYQSAIGLKHDLKECLEQLNSTGTCRYFKIGRRDALEKFQVPQRLYGRQKETKTLLDAFERVCQGNTEMILVAGYAGIGKTSLVREIYKPLVQKRGYFISGKFDQFKQHIPYASLIQAFQELVRQLLTETGAQIMQWKSKILSALGRNTRVIIDVIPEVELIVGKQEPVPELPAPQSQNRFNRVFQDFIRVFTTPRHPLTVYLDDLQWIDLASLKLMELILMEVGNECLFLIGAYRDNEVDASHPLILTFSALKEKGIDVGTIVLPPLDLKDVNRLIADTLHCSMQTTHALAKLCRQKTGGNPFFLKQFLHTLYHQQLIRLDSQNMCWSWDIGKITRAGITENVVDLMVEKIRKIPARTQQALKLAAAVGACFSLKILALVTQQNYKETGEDLWKALQENFIFPTDEKYKYALIPDQTGFKSIAGLAEFKFTHDRIQQAAYSLIEPADRPEIHLKIGGLMLEKIPKEKQEERIFEIVNHLNLGMDLIKKGADRLNLAKLNLRAGKKSKDAIAYNVSLKYFDRGIQLLGSNCWKNHYKLTIDLYKNYVESLYLCGDFSQSEQTIFQVMEKLKSPLDKAVFYKQLIIQYTMEAKYHEAIDLTFKALSLLKIDMQVPNYEEAIQEEISSIKSKLRHRSIASLLDLPEITDKKISMGIAILSDMLPICYFINQSLYSFAITRAINLAFRYGHIAEMAFVYVSYGLILVGKYQEYPDAYEFGRLALKLSVKFNNDTQKCKVAQNFANHIYIWKKHIKGAMEINRECFNAGLNSGELQFPGYGRNNQAFNRYFQGDPIESLLPDVESYLQFTKKTNNLISTDTLNSMDLILRNLNNQTGSMFSFHNQDFKSDNDFIEACATRNSWYAICAFLVHQAQVFYLYGEYEKALACITEAKELISYMPASIVTVEQKVFESLLFLHHCINHPKDKKKYIKTINENQKQLKRWADNCPENFLHLFLLVKAEIARMRGNEPNTMKLYEQAIDAARENGFTWHEALANELVAKFYLDLGVKKIAIIHMTESHYGYKMWGAAGKVQDLEKKYPHLLPITLEKENLPFESAKEKQLAYTLKEKSQTEANRGVFDIMTFIKASQVLAGEIFLERLLKKMMQIVLETAGAEKGIFLLEKKGRLVMEALGIMADPHITVLPAIPIEDLGSRALSSLLSQIVVEYVTRTKDAVILNDAASQEQFTHDEYIAKQKPKSVLCMPLLHQNSLQGVLYLENNLTCGAFTGERIQILELLSSQMAISIENARIHDRLGKLVEKRTSELRSSYEQLRKEIAERKKNEESLKISEEKFAKAFRHTPSLMVIATVEHNRIIEVNESFARVLGYRHEELIGHTTLELNLWVNPERRRRFVDELKQDKEVRNMEVEVRKKSGDICSVLLSAALIHLNGEPHVLSIAIDITDRKKLEEQLHTAAITDELTGVYNRRGFFALAEQQCKLADRTKRRMSLLFLDVDDLKIINDRFGHKSGDEALEDTANILKQTFRKSDIIGRIGGDEFAVLLTEHTESDIESVITHNIRKNFYRHNQQGGRKYHLSMSIGIARYDPEYPCSFGELLIKADTAMYEDKRHRKLNAFNTKLKKRRHKRYQAQTHWLRLEGVDEFEIKNISVGGLCLKTAEMLPLNNTYTIEISPAINGKTILKGSVVWSLLVESQPRATGEKMLYEAGFKFIGLSDRQKIPLKKLLRKLTH